MSIAANPLIPRDGTLVLSDGAALSLTLLYEEGDLDVQGFEKGSFDFQSFWSRGQWFAGRETQTHEMEIAFSCYAVGLIGDGSTALIGDVINRLGVWASATSTLPTSTGGAYTVKLAWTGDRTSYGGSANSTLTMKYVRLSAGFSEGVGAKWSIKGRLVPYSSDYLTIT